MEYGYYPGCSLTGSARKLDQGVKKVMKALGHTLTEIPDWNCCGALEYGDKEELAALSKENLKKAPIKEIIAPCPACYKNLKDADTEHTHTILNPLELDLSSLKAVRDLKGQVFTPYYGCVLLRPEGSAIKNRNVMEEFIASHGGEIAGEKIKDRCCGGNQFFVHKWATEKLSTLILEKSKGTIVAFCPLCHMALHTFSKESRVIYLTDLALYLMGEKNSL
jgi:heterodisulfide reductase subunit B2